MKNIRIEIPFAAVLFLMASPAMAQQNDVPRLMQEGVNAHGRGDYSSAIDRYRAVLKIKPDLLPALVNLGISLVQVGRFPEAVESYRKALSIEPANARIQRYLGLAYFKSGDAANAARQFEPLMRANLMRANLMRANPADMGLASLLAASYMQQGENARALSLLQPLAANASDDADFQWTFGSALIANGNLRAGAEAVERAAQKTNAPEEWKLAGQTLLRLNDFERALRDLETSVRLNPDLPGAQTLLGQAREKNADYQGAIEACRKAVAQNENDFDAWLTLGSDQYFLRDLDGARASLGHALVLNPESAPALYALALVHKKQGRTEAAISSLEHAVKILPTWMEAHVQLAALYVQAHREADGARERELVDRLAEGQRKAGPAPN